MAWKSDLLLDDMQVRLFIGFICSSYIFFFFGIVQHDWFNSHYQWICIAGVRSIIQLFVSLDGFLDSGGIYSTFQESGLSTLRKISTHGIIISFLPAHLVFGSVHIWPFWL